MSFRLPLSCLFFFFFGQMLAEQSDSVVSRRSIFVIPQASYQPETSWAPGIAYGFYFPSNDISRISSIVGSAVYTFRRQFIFSTTPRIFFADNKWYLFSNLHFRDFPDYFFGIGNEKTDIEEAFTTRFISILLQPQYEIRENFFVGANFSARTERARTNFSSAEMEQHIFDTFGTTGWTPYHRTSIGGVATFDSRDNFFYPFRGTFLKTAFGLSRAGWASTYSLQTFELDFRKYIPMPFNEHVFAFQFKFDGIFGDEIPFQLLPTLGGPDLLRGFRQWQYRDNMLFATQAEYRFPIFRRLKASIFCAMGDVYSSRNFQLNNTMKFAYGVGLRYRLNDARVHLRVDIARNNFGDGWQFYIRATEAF